MVKTPKHHNRKSLAKRLTHGLVGALSLTAGTLGLISCSYLNQQIPTSAQTTEQITPANRELRNLATLLENDPRIENVTTYETPGARYCLVHLGQLHYRQVSTPIDDAFIRRAQNDLYKILWPLVDSGINEIYAEGIHENNVNRANNPAFLETMLNTPRTNIQELVALRQEFASLIREHSDENHEPEQATMNKKPRLAYAVENLAYERLITINYADSQRLNEIADCFARAIETGEMQPNPLYEFLAHEARENNVLLNICAQNQNNPIAVVIYGDNHNFLPNIEEWNKRFPNYRFSLIDADLRSVQMYIDFWKRFNQLNSENPITPASPENN